MSVDLAKLRNLVETARAHAAQQQHGGRTWYRIENRGGAADAPASVYLYDMIGEWGVTAQDFVNDLRSVSAPAIDLHVSCEGGEVIDGLAMYESLRTHPAQITAYVDGIAASAASFVIQAANKIIMAPRAKLMIHDAHGVVMGNARDMLAMATLLDSLSDTIADIYAERSGGTRAQWRAAMAAAQGGPDGSWYDAQEAVDAGLADEVAGQPEPVKPVARATADVPIWSPGAFLDAIKAVENPIEPVELPTGTALLAAIDLP
jgi:ATP-dependent protease ClpP protease subunit